MLLIPFNTDFYRFHNFIIFLNNYYLYENFCFNTIRLDHITINLIICMHELSGLFCYINTNPILLKVRVFVKFERKVKNMKVFTLKCIFLLIALLNLNRVKAYRISKMEIWDDDDNKNVHYPETLHRYDDYYEKLHGFSQDHGYDHDHSHNHDDFDIKDLLDFVPMSEKLLRAIHDIHDVLPKVGRL